ncbi:MAG TPA: FliM/FliN family flagellar motor switch protein [Sphingomonas sp.]|nr:FliM/FliN family flagellar motor switch protein [Sphingomonas sp.]
MTAVAERKVEPAVLDAPRLPPGEIPGLDRVAQRLARGLAQTLPGYGLEARIATAAVRPARAESWHDRVAGDAWIRFAIPEISSHATVTFPFPLIVRAIDRYYGGEGVCATDARELTPAEARSLRSLGKALAPAISGAWGEVATFSPVVEDAGHAVSRPAAAKLDETLAVQEFTLTDADGKDWQMTCAMPQEPLHRLPGLKSDAAPARDVSPVWSRHLREAMMDVRLPVRTVLSRPDLSLERLLTLAPGDVIPVLLPAFVPLSVGGRVIGHGTIGEENGRAAIRLERMEGGFGR